MIHRYTVPFLVLGALAPGCGSRDPGEIRVFAASSLTEVMGTVARDYEAATGTGVRLNLAASSTLARQIVEGAPCDVFLSADGEWADFVEEAGRVVPGSRRVLLTNSLVVVVPRADAAGKPSAEVAFGFLSGRGPLLDPGTKSIAMGDPDHVPAGRYGRRALGPDWDRVRAKVVPCDSVRGALALVARGEVDAGVVYRTDAESTDRVSVVGRLAGGGVEYPVVEIRGGSPVARRFADFLGSPAARTVFGKAGFGFPEPR